MTYQHIPLLSQQLEPQQLPPSQPIHSEHIGNSNCEKCRRTHNRVGTAGTICRTASTKKTQLKYFRNIHAVLTHFHRSTENNRSRKRFPALRRGCLNGQEWLGFEGCVEQQQVPVLQSSNEPGKAHLCALDGDYNLCRTWKAEGRVYQRERSWWGRERRRGARGGSWLQWVVS